MIRSLYITTLLFLTGIEAFSQTAKPFEKYSLDSSYSVIGFSPSGSFKRFNFILSRPEDLNQLKKDWIFKAKAKPLFRENYFDVFIIKDKKIVSSFLINPSYNNICVDGNWYQFNSSLLEELHKKAPLYHHKVEKIFATEEQYRLHNDSAKRQASFLFLSEPNNLKYEGKFYITYTRSNSIKDFKIATSVLNKELLKIATKDKFRAGYELSDYNINNPSKFQVTVEGAKALYDRLNGDYEKGPWTDRVIKATSFWRDSVEIVNTQLNVSDSIYAVKSVEVMPEYPGGMEKFLNFIGENYRVPSSVHANGISGRLVGTFVVEKDGSMTDFKIIEDLGYGTGEELIRVLKACEKWKPGLQDNKAVRVQYTIPIKVNLNEGGRGAYRTPAAAGYSTLPDNPKTSEAVKLPALSFARERYMFGERFNKCMPDTFLVEEKKLALSDRYSVLQHIIESVPQDSLKKLTGRVSLQVLIDTVGKPCLLSLKSELNMPYTNLHFDEAINNKTKWSLLAANGKRKEAVSVILVFTFTETQVKYQHLSFSSQSALLTELESSIKGKFSRY